MKLNAVQKRTIVNCVKPLNDQIEEYIIELQKVYHCSRKNAEKLLAYSISRASVSEEIQSVLSAIHIKGEHLLFNKWKSPAN